MDQEKEERFASQHCGLSPETVDFLIAAITAPSIEAAMQEVEAYLKKLREA